MDELHLPRTKFQQATKIQSADLKALGVEVQENGVPLLALIVELFEVYKSIRAEMRNTGGSDDEAVKIDLGFKREKLTQLRIKNQTALSQLAPISVMKERMITTLTAYRQMMILFMKDASKNFPGDHRENEEKLTRVFNQTIEKVYSDIAEIKEWELDSNARLIMTRITNSEQETDLVDDLNAYNYKDVSIPELDGLIDSSDGGY